MHRAMFPTLVVISLSVGLQGSSTADDWIPLVTKQDASGELAGWKSFHETAGTKTGDVWKLADDGALVCRGNPKGYLYTEKGYTDFVLRLEWRWPEGKPGNGGVLIRMTGGHKIWPASLEAQINAGGAGDFWGLDGYPLSGLPERTKRLEHPQFGKLTNVQRTADLEKPAGQWNSYEIRAKGSTVTLIINGQEVNRAADCAVRPGKICLTSEGNEIHYRNVELQAGEKSE
ncbi:MAG: DUF1080 domain-containing protein [Pirellulales bacterium]|nr:DUF1080 domain-containing protein [Pirellulales bacterium]